MSPFCFFYFRRCVSIAFGICFLLAATRLIYSENYILAGIFLLLGLGLFMNKAWANRGTAWIFVLAAIVIPVGVINPFNAGDLMARQAEVPTVPQLLAWIIPLDLALLCLAWLLDPPRKKKN
ncbi:MAG: hypothetical protein D3922_09430 [Candidatus Electrothrix sp. AR1]|nr:hypothetical protein [Candidatus Electrothrix sp. AR1]